MTILDNLKQIKKLDPAGVGESITMLAGQINQAWSDFKKVKLPANYKSINKVLVNGMGGSALGPHIFRSLFYSELKVPYGIINSYQTPACLDKNTLYILSSYSGTTEETLATLGQAQKAGAKIFAVASGGPLADWVKQGKIAGYIFQPKFNPSGQPRMGLGYSLGAQLGLFKKLGLIKVSEADLKKSLALVDRLAGQFGLTVPLVKNEAKKLALLMADKVPVAVAAEFLAGNAHALANQINENAKTFANYFLISELNHHLLEGLSFPKSNPQNLFFLFFESKLYQPKNQVRCRITKEVLAKNRIKFFHYPLKGAGKLSQVLEMLVFGSFASFYLALLNNVNPSKIPWVDYFKAQLKKYS